VKLVWAGSPPKLAEGLERLLAIHIRPTESDISLFDSGHKPFDAMLLGELGSRVNILDSDGGRFDDCAEISLVR
jgi:hypothetical protein